MRRRNGSGQRCLRRCGRVNGIWRWIRWLCVRWRGPGSSMTSREGKRVCIRDFGLRADGLNAGLFEYLYPSRCGTSRSRIFAASPSSCQARQAYIRPRRECMLWGVSTPRTHSPRRPIQPPPYSGRLTFRGRLEPCQSTTITPSLWITRPGTYSLGNWKAETEVYEQEETAGGTPAVRHRYLQTPAPGDDVYISVSDIVRR